jgi:serine/threonine-protein kinase
MAPEQFHGKAVFASDVYSVGVTMYQMLTGALPYNTPSPEDLDRLMRGQLTTPPREVNRRIPRGISDIVMKAMAPDVSARYQRAGDLLEAVLAARGRPAAPIRRLAPLDAAEAADRGGDDIQARVRARQGPQARFCWHCRKPLHARADSCPFCGESQ